MRAFDLAASVPWAIRPDALQVILDLAARAEVSPETVAAAMSGSPSALAARLGRPMDNAHRMTVRDGVAVMPVNGPIFRYANLFSEVSGATSSDVLARDLATALDDPAVSAILLEVDSPGGEVAGTAELASMIRAANERKPVWAYVDHLGASAAYWLSAATERIVVAPTAILGSIGVVSALRDPSKSKSNEIEFVSSQSPRKRADITTEAGRAQVQAVVDALADVFVSDVARYRGASPETVLSDFGQGDVFVGQAAVTAGLADAVGSFEQAVTDLAHMSSTSDRTWARSPMDRRGMSTGFSGAALAAYGTDGAETPAFSVGDRVLVVGPPHMDGHDAGEVKAVEDAYAYGILFDGMAAMGIHRWYIEDELRAETAGGDDPSPPPADDQMASMRRKRSGSAAPARRAVVGMRDRFFSWLDGLDAEADGSGQPSSPEPAAAGTTPPEVSMADEKTPALAVSKQASQFAELQTRNATLEAELAATKAAAEANAEQSKLLAERVKAMETDARRKRFTDEVLGKSDASGVRWFGETARHVAMLEHLADTAGEDSAVFTGYVTQQRALAEQLRSSKLFDEIGASGGATGAATAWDRIEAAARKLIEHDSKLTMPAAIDRVLSTDKTLAAEYVAEQRSGSPTLR